MLVVEVGLLLGGCTVERGSAPDAVDQSGQHEVVFVLPGDVGPGPLALLDELLCLTPCPLRGVWSQRRLAVG